MPSKKTNPYYQAQSILARRDHSEAEVRQKMKKKGFSYDEIDQIIDWLKDQKLLDDAEFARKYAKSLVQSKPVGPLYIRNKFRGKQVADHIVEDAIAKAYEETSEEELIEQAASTWKKIHVKHASDRQRLMRHLASRGFTTDKIYAVANQQDNYS